MNNKTIKFKAEGLKNAVFEYKSQNAHKVIRVRKKKKQKHKEEDVFVINNEEIFYTQTMRALIGEKYCLPIELIPLQSLYDSITQELTSAESQRAQRFVKLTEIDLNCSHGFLMDDHTLCQPHELKNQQSPIFCVELKPKSGQMSTFHYISEENRKTKQLLCPYCLRQCLKLKVGDVDDISEYCPNDLFSGDHERVKKALLSLLKNPQNNLKLFFNGSLCFTGKLGGKHEEMNIHSFSDLNSLLSEYLFPQECHKFMEQFSPIKYFIESLCNILLQEKQLLQKISEIQQKDRYSIEAIGPVYQKIVDFGLKAQLDDYCLKQQQRDFTQPTAEQIAEEEEFLTSYHELSLFSENNMRIAFRIVKDFLLAATIKDCSIMITMIPSTDGELIALSDSTWSCVNYSKIATEFKDLFCIYYRLAVVDVDRKLPQNIPNYVSLDKQIMESAKKIQDEKIFRNCKKSS